MSLFDRAAFIEKVRVAFVDVEKLLGTGDAFDYEEVAVFSGMVNRSQEHVIILPLTQASVSFHIQKTLGNDTSWNDIDKLPLYGFYMMSPTDCIHSLNLDTAYLVRAVSWERAEVVNAAGRVERMFVTWVRRGESSKAHFTFRGNVEIHLETCWTSSSNQV
ncbi:hypothetical protein KAR02_05605 [Candidatus Bipolaricaulota bacterium]|nr:hypothetical protein [Candidatus Bipolaricaulota bacterium]